MITIMIMFSTIRVIMTIDILMVVMTIGIISFCDSGGDVIGARRS